MADEKGGSARLDADQNTIVPEEAPSHLSRSRSTSSSSQHKDIELHPVKSSAARAADEAEKDVESQRDMAELQPIKTSATGMSHLSRHSSVIERNYSHAQSDMARDIVGWDGEEDPENPRNWATKRKVLVMGWIAAICFVSPLASSMFAPGVTFMNKEFGNTSTTLTSLVVSVYVLGWAVGPLILSPLSEIYGRRRVIDCANWFFVVWQIGCALAPNLNALIVFRFLAGIGGSASITIGGGVIADLFAPDVRGAASAAFAMGPLFGPVVGPICGGFIAQRIGWRWVYWIILIAGAVVSAGMTIFSEETNPEILLARKTERLRKETGNPNLISWYDRDREIKPPAEILKHGLIRPLKLLVKSPICALMCLYMSTVYGVLYLLFTSATLVFGWQYKFSPETSGLAYLGFGIGFFLGLACQAVVSDKMLLKLAARNNGVAEPEMRLPLCAAFSIFIPIALFWYGWSADQKVHWIVPIIGMVPFGVGMMGVFLPVQTYMIDAFPEYAASAIAALTSTRSLVGAFLPMAGTPMYQAVGLGWGNSILAFASLVLGGCVFLLYKYGKAIREKYPVKL